MKNVWKDEHAEYDLGKRQDYELRGWLDMADCTP